MSLTRIAKFQQLNNRPINSGILDEFEHVGNVASVGPHFSYGPSRRQSNTQPPPEHILAEPFQANVLESHTVGSHTRFLSPALVEAGVNEGVTQTLEAASEVSKGNQQPPHQAFPSLDPHSVITPTTTWSVNPSLQDEFEQAERNVHKCRSRATTIAWFEIQSLAIWNAPPAIATNLEDLTADDLLVNWVDENKSRCQVWRRGNDGSWSALRWGAKTQDAHRFIITEKGQPSFVAESTWKKRYKSQTARIILFK